MFAADPIIPSDLRGCRSSTIGSTGSARYRLADDRILIEGAVRDQKPPASISGPTPSR